MKYRIKWTLSGESVVSEAHDADDAQDMVAEAVGRGAPPLRVEGTEVEHTRWDYKHDSASAEDG